MSDKPEKASKEEIAVIAALGDTGQKVVDFVHKTVSDTMKANADELRAAIGRFNEHVASCEAREIGYNDLLNSMSDALNKARGAHSSVATSVNDGKQVTPAAVAEAVEATEKVQRLEDSWKVMVDKTLEAHDKTLDDLKGRVSTLEGKNKVPTMAPVPAPEPNPKPKAVEPEPNVVTVEPNKPDQTNVFVAPSQPTVVRYVNPKLWGGLARALAAAGFIIGGIVVLNIWGGFFPGVPAAIQWVRWLTLLLIPVFGLFTGGALGSYIESKQQPVRETVVA